jgi:geranylgeranyl diphosphate synthase type I
MTTMQAAVRDLAQVLSETRELAGPAHRAVIDGLPAGIRHIAGYHAGWWDADGRPCARAGKSLRLALAFACARAADGDPADAVPAAVAVELVHDFSLLHDDVMDGDLTRRHRPAAWAVFGTGAAILAGDMLLAAAFRLPVPGTQVHALADAVAELCHGQSSDLAFEARMDVGLAECLSMAERKTGALIGAACQLGALAAGAGPEAAECYRAFGRHLGVAFQLADDLLGIWGDPEVTGKPAGGDLTSGKKSLPVVAALTSGTTPGDRLASLYGCREGPDEQGMARAARLIEDAGGRDWARSETTRQVQQAMGHLTNAEPAPEGAADLRLLAGLVVHRSQ